MNKSDRKNTQSQLDFLNENLSSLNKEQIMKANIQDVMVMLDKKANNDEYSLELGYIKQSL